MKYSTYTNEELRQHQELWALALESGEYSQIRKALRRNDGFCCLGVGCDISSLNIWIKEEFTGIYTYSDSEHTLPFVVQNWLGLNTTDGSYKNESEDVLQRLSINNDSGIDFKDIAATIRRRPEGLFVNP